MLGLLAACGSGGGGSAGAGTSANGAFGAVQLLGHVPADEAVQVALDAVITLTFDATMAVESFADEDTWLRVVGSDVDVPCTFARGSAGRVSCQPDSPLEPETDYEFQLSALTCDASGRILDVTASFTFRTVDQTPPAVVGADVDAGAQNVGRLRTFTVTFSEALDQDSVDGATLYLRDVFGARYAADYSFDGAAVTIAPLSDLPGDRQFTLVAGLALADRAGNRLASSWTSSFRTVADVGQPHVTSAWPASNSGGRSPLLQPTFTFDESMDPATVEPTSLLFQDEFGSLVPFVIDASADQRTLRVRPTVTLQPSRRYTMAFLLGGAAATDVSGNPLAATQALTFTTGTDTTAPQIVTSTPADGESRAPGTAVLEVTFDEALDAAFVDVDTVSLVVGDEPWTAVVELSGDRVVRVTPVLTLPPDTPCRVTLRGGQEGLHDVAGNVLAADATIGFTTSADTGSPVAMISPPDGATSIARNAHVSVVFDAPMDTATLTSDTVLVTDDYGNAYPGTLQVQAGGRAVHFSPATPWAADTYYRVRVKSGAGGARRVSGNWFELDRTARFHTGASSDSVAPVVNATINDLPASRRDGLVVPPSGFTIDVSTYDTSSQWVDMSSIEVHLDGGVGPSAADLAPFAEIGYGTYRVVVPGTDPLSSGQWTLTVSARDLAGNLSTSAAIPFAVDTASGGALPFEITQVVWVRTDLDRDGNGHPDFEDDMLRLGFATAGDPAGTNANMRRVVLNGILAKSNHVYGRGSRGEPLDASSVSLRFSTRQPIGVPHMQISLGGLDPSGGKTRAYGSDSTGVLGRAYYDYRNSNLSERNTSTSPALGVFPAEMFLYQARIHEQVYPSYQTLFASRFLPICPDMGGTPAGSHALDATVLGADFDYSLASTAERARYNQLMAAADDWVSVIGIILAHEVGHSVGLVAPGAMPGGLFGDSSLHDSYAGAAEVMAPSVGYEAMTTLDYAFRDIDLAYLRQRVLLR
ncbi:MAG: Ig-like domain-containing protein [Planctomycetes bacterium]|nr:Ig-like domain-containing protein [Planctomycetota bacterium]